MAKSKETPATKAITIQGLKAEVSAPYAEGHTITEAEAAALNQVRSENIRNNTARLVKAAIDEAGVEKADELGADVVEGLKAKIAEYDAEYVFNMASVGGGRQPTDPVEVEAKKMARQLINAQLKSQGKKVGDVDKDAYNNAVATVAAKPEIRERAEKALKDREAAAAAAMEGIDL